MTLFEIEKNRTIVIENIGQKNRRRLLELGLIEGKRIKKLYESFDKKMVAVEIDGTIIGLRKGICELIKVREDD